VPSPQQRAETAALLRARAHELLAESGLFALLAENFGEPMVTGSAGYDLMVRPQIDIHMPAEAGRWADWLAFGTTLARHFDAGGTPLLAARYANGWLDPEAEGGLGWTLDIRGRDGDWQLALRGWDPFDFAVRQARDFSLRTDLAACDRDLILRLKTEALARPAYYGVKVSGLDIYRFVIAGAGDSLSALELWQRRA